MQSTTKFNMVTICCPSWLGNNENGVPLSFYRICKLDFFVTFWKINVFYNSNQERDNWASKSQFLLACIGYCVGLGNIWRFPYLVYESGGACFLIPYFIMLLLVGLPCLYMELAVGLITQRGPVHAMKAICPLFKGESLLDQRFKTVETIFTRHRLCNHCNGVYLCVIFFDNYCLLPVLFFQFLPFGSSMDILWKSILVNGKLHRWEYGTFCRLSSCHTRIFWSVVTFIKKIITNKMVYLMLYYTSLGCIF